ncbi:MAG TPA: penicillin-binding protein activator, partial [bacterium]|nr:penicillin-binding protein activator [bacterium]
SLIPDAIFRIGLVDEALGDVPNAGRSYQKLIADFPGSDLAGEARLRLGIAYFHAERWADAVEILRAYEKRAHEPRKMSNARLLMAEALEKQGKVAETAPFRLRAAKDLEDPMFAAWNRDKAMAALEKVTDPSVIQPLADEFPDDPVTPRLLARLADAKYSARDYAGALAAAKTVVEKYPDSNAVPLAAAIIKRAGARENVDPRTIGVAVPLSGDFEAYGQKALQSILLAANVFGPEEKGEKVRVAVRDSAGDAGKAAQAIEDLYQEESVVGVVGPLLSNETEAAAPRAQALGLPMITLAQKKGLTDAGNYIFRNSMTASAQSKAIAAFAFDKLGAKRFAIVYPNNAYGEEFAFLFWDEVKARGGEVTGIEHYDPKDADFTHEVEDLVGRGNEFIPARKDEWDDIKKAQKELQQKNPGKKLKDPHFPPIVDFDAVFVPDDFKHVGQLLPFFALADVPIGGYLTRNPNLKAVVPLGTNGWDNPELIARGGRYVEGSYFVDAFNVDSQTPEVKAFTEKFLGTYLRAPDILDALAYDTTAVLVDRVHGGANNREKLRDALDGMKGFHGVTGLTGFSRDRDATRDLTVLTVADREIKAVGDLKGPAPAPTPGKP